jgi:5-methylcytosine-specific restriction endonuclease McrA
MLAFPKPSKHKPLDTSMLPFPKTRRVKSQKTIDKTRKKACEACGSIKGLQTHHVFTRGSGAPDIEVNLVTLCVACHAKAHNGQIGRDDLLDVVAEREGKSVEEIRKIIGQAMGREYA